MTGENARVSIPKKYPFQKNTLTRSREWSILPAWAIDAIILLLTYVQEY
jgi:hypothetical protein